MDDLRDLALFVAVAETRSFTRAAQRLGLPTSSISRRIAALEATLGLQLLRRSTRRVELTEAGGVYLARCQGIVTAAREAHEEVRGLVETPSGKLRLSLEAELGPRLVAPVIAEFLAAHPAVSVEIDLSPRRVDVVGENFDLAIRLGTLPDSSLTVRRLAMLQAGLYAAPAYLKRRGTPGHPDQLADHARLHLLHEGDRGEWRLTRGKARLVVGPPGRAAANNMAMMRHLARLGVGIALLDELLVADDLVTGALSRVLADWALPPVPLSVLTPSRLLPAKTRTFIALLAARLGGVVGLSP